MNTNDVIKLYDEYVMPTYLKSPLVLVRGRNTKVWDIEGKEYLDFFPGWAVSGLGHCHPFVVRALKRQLSKIMHVSNNFYNELQGALAKVISANSFDGKVFFANSGAEANEAAVKLARLYGNPKRFEIISMENSFHGRTLATLTLTGQKKHRQGFDPLPAGFNTVPFNDIKAIEEAVSDKTIAIIIEPVQGEGGINMVSKEYIRFLRRFCTKKDILLIFDEVQTGMGRTGKMFCFQNFDIEPDLMSLAKTLGGGFPIGALVAKRKFANVFGPGMHASTFGGNPLACASSLAVFEAIEANNLLLNVVRMGDYLFKKIKVLKEKFSFIKEIRGIGLMLGIELSRPGKPIVEACMKEGLLINCTQERVLRLLPPITINKKEIDSGIKILEKGFLSQL